jgi:hypothetical protein
MRLCLSVPAGRSWGRVPHVSDILEGPPCFASDEGQEPARNVGMRDASRHSLVHDDQGALAAGAAVPGELAARGRGGCHPQRGWRESVTVTWSPAPAPHRRAAAGTGAAAAGNPGSFGAVITTTQTLTYLGARVGWPGKSRDLLRAPTESPQVRDTPADSHRNPTDGTAHPGTLVIRVKGTENSRSAASMRVSWAVGSFSR